MRLFSKSTFSIIAAFVLSYTLTNIGTKDLWDAIFKPSVTVSDVEAFLQSEEIPKHSRDMFAQIETDFPQDYSVFIDEMVETLNSGSDRKDKDIGLKLGVRFINNLINENAPYLTVAPQPAFAKLHQDFLALLKTMRDTPDLCGMFLIGDPGFHTRENLGRVNMDLMAQHTSSTLSAITKGRTSPIQILPVTGEEFGKSLTHWVVTTGQNEAQVAAMVGGDWRSPTYCTGFLEYLTWLAETPTEQNDRVIRFLHIPR